MKVRALTAAVYLMAGIISLTLAVAFASWLVRPSSAQNNPPPELPKTEMVPPQVGTLPQSGSLPPPTGMMPPQQSPQAPTAANIPPPPGRPEMMTPPTMPQSTPPSVPPSLPTATPPAQVLNLPARDFLEPYIFDAREGRRNPFRPLSLQADDGGMALGPATPLERYDVDELKLLAIMWDVKNPRAMLMDPNKEIHIVGKDDRIGRKKGYVATIREGEIVIVETSEFNGEAVYSTRIMQIQK